MRTGNQAVRADAVTDYYQLADATFLTWSSSTCQPVSQSARMKMSAVAALRAIDPCSILAIACHIGLENKQKTIPANRLITNRRRGLLPPDGLSRYNSRGISRT